MFRDTILWKGAFDKYGFEDGRDGDNTNTIARHLKAKGYEVEVLEWGAHNIVITKISKNGNVLMDDSVDGFDREADPEKYLPEDVSKVLNDRFGKNDWYL